jgi:superfamily II DNA or RNA helicase
MESLRLRNYQDAACAAVEKAWSDGILRPAVVMATGLGKTAVIAALCHRAATAGRKPLVLVHRDELARQAVDKIRAFDRSLRVGVVKAAENEVDAQVVVGSVQTLARLSRREQLRDVGLVIVDEAHHAAARTYMEILEHYGCFRDVLALGVTATMNRADDRGLGDVWQDVVFKRDILFGIREGFLVDVRGTSVAIPDLDLGKVKKSRGDYQDGALGDALIEADAGSVVAEAYREHAADRQGALFAPTVAAAQTFADALNAAGIPTETVTGETPTEERQLIYKRTRHGDTQVLSSVGVLTEGFDMPQLSCAVLARPTQSHGLYVQMAGRVLRPHPGKRDALLLDVVGASEGKSLRSIVDLTETGIRPQPGELLLEALEREETEGAARDASVRLQLDVSARELDLFTSSHAAWLQTAKGVWFIPTREHTYFLWPDGDDGTFKIGKCGVYSARGGEWLMGGLSLDLAMSWAEQYAEEEDPMVASRDASWRKKKARPSEAQVGHAVRLGINVKNLSKNELSNAISIHHASKILDRAVS